MKLRNLRPKYFLPSLIFLLAITALQSTAEAVDRALPRLVPQQGSISAVTKLAFSPDGRQLVTSGGVAIVWDVASGTELARLADQDEGFPSVVYSPNGDSILTIGRRGNVIAWDWKTGATSRFADAGGRVSGLASCPRGKRLLGSIGKALVVWSVADGKIVHTLSEHTEDISALTASMDCSKAVTATFSGQVIHWDLTRGKRVASWNSPRQITSLAMSPVDERVAIGHSGGHVSVWNFPIRRMNSLLAEHNIAVTTLTFSRDGGRIATGGEDGLAVVWEFHSDNIIKRIRDVSNSGADFVPRFRSVAFSPSNQNLLATAGYGRYAIIWNVSTGKEVIRFEPKVNYVRSVAIAPDSGSILVGSWDRSAVIWDVKSGKAVQRFEGHSKEVISVAFSPDGMTALTGGADKTAILWDVSSGRELARLTTEGYVESVAFVDNGRALLGTFNKALIWNVNDRSVEKVMNDGRGPITSVGVSSQGTLGITDSTEAKLWDLTTGVQIRRFGNSEFERLTLGPAAISRSGRIVVTAHMPNFDGNGIAIVWDASSGSKVAQLSGVSMQTAMSQLHYDSERGHEGVIMAIAISQDDRKIVTGGKDGRVIVWDLDTKNPIKQLAGHSAEVFSIALSMDDNVIVTGSQDGTTKLWNAASGDLVATQISFSERAWAVVQNDGRFDTNEPEKIAGLNWVFPDDPATPLSPEIFLRDYFEPGLMARLWDCHKAEKTRLRPCEQEFKPVGPLESLNRAQPEVKVISIIPEMGAQDDVSVTIEIRGIQREFGSRRDRTWRSGAYDLRLFRDGQLVRQEPNVEGPQALDVLEPAAELAAWRARHRVVDALGKQTFTFRHIRLPRREQGDVIEFSAYAFNVDRVKSATARATYTVPQSLPPPQRRAYVVAIGVSAYEDQAWDLKYADDDARRFVEVLEPRLVASGRYHEVVPIRLLSDWEMRDGRRVVREATATKENVKAILDLLAGRSVPTELRDALPNGIRLQRATPDDLVLIAFSSHGYADKAGNFYLFPYDIGADTGKTVTPTILSRAISSAELSMWLRDIDAGEFVLVVDACHSAASVENSEFKPGPMGARGLGQLAYDKGMRILASTRADDVAWESPATQQGLLSYALVQNGLVEGKADFRPADGSTGILEWLQYGVERVPHLYAEAMAPRTAGTDHSARLITFDSETRSARQFEPVGSNPRPAVQQPTLFSYKRGPDPMLTVRPAN